MLGTTGFHPFLCLGAQRKGVVIHMDNLTLGQQIAELRKAKGWTQEGLANELGVTNQAVSKWETGLCYPDVQLLPKLADIFKISLDALFGRPAPAPQVWISELPWEDDGNLRAVLYVGHKLRHHQFFDRYGDAKAKIEFHYEGAALNITSDFSVHCANSVISGSIHAGDSVLCENCSVQGSVDAGDNVTCGDVGGNVDAGDSVICGNVGGNVDAGDGVSCQHVAGSIDAGDSVHCGNVMGAINAGGNVYCKG